jgi:hypothetical protein
MAHPRLGFDRNIWWDAIKYCGNGPPGLFLGTQWRCNGEATDIEWGCSGDVMGMVLTQNMKIRQEFRY